MLHNLSLVLAYYLSTDFCIIYDIQEYQKKIKYHDNSQAKLGELLIIDSTFEIVTTQIFIKNRWIFPFENCIKYRSLFMN